jgi:hypothetical protein
MKIFSNGWKYSQIFGHIHNQHTQKDNLMNFFFTKDYFGFLLHLLFHDYNGLLYDYN